MDEWEQGDRRKFRDYLVSKVETFYNENPRDEHGRFTGPGRGVSEIAQTVVRRLKGKEQGATLSPVSGRPVRKGFAVGGVLKPTFISAGDLNTESGTSKAEKAIGAWLKSVSDKSVFSQSNNDIKIGAWFNEAKGRIEIEPSQHIQTESEAKGLGNQRHQEGVQDLTKKGSEGYVSTGGSGHFVPAESPFKILNPRTGQHERK